MSAPDEPRPGSSITRVAIAAAPATFVLLWSTGFVGAKYGLPYAEPFTFLGWRLLAAAALLALVGFVIRAPRLSGRAQYGRSAISGILLHAGYLGGTFFAISQGIPAGVAAVIVSLQPVLVAALSARVLGDRLTRLQWVGVAAGLVGVLLVLAPALLDAGRAAEFPTLGLLSSVVALLAGTVGTLHQKRYGDGIPLVFGTAVQYAAAVVLLMLLATTTETMQIQWTGEFVASFLWLVIVLSLGAVLLLLWLLRRGSAAGVSSLFYLVPPATAVEAYLLFDEQLAVISLIGIAVTTVGVALALRPARVG